MKRFVKPFIQFFCNSTILELAAYFKVFFNNKKNKKNKITNQSMKEILQK